MDFSVQRTGEEGFMTRCKFNDDVLADDYTPLHVADVAAHGEEAVAKKKLEHLKKLIHTLLVEVGAAGSVQAPGVESGCSFYEAVQRFEIDLIKRALSQTGGHQRRAAHLLGIKPTTLNNKIKFYHIDIRATVADPETDTCDSR